MSFIYRYKHSTDVSKVNAAFAIGRYQMLRHVDTCMSDPAATGGRFGGDFLEISICDPASAGCTPWLQVPLDSIKSARDFRPPRQLTQMIRDTHCDLHTPEYCACTPGVDPWNKFVAQASFDEDV